MYSRSRRIILLHRRRDHRRNGVRVLHRRGRRNRNVAGYRRGGFPVFPVVAGDGDGGDCGEEGEEGEELHCGTVDGYMGEVGAGRVG